MKRYYTAESVTEGHPDKICDQISDAVLDACLREDSEARVACEVMALAGKVVVAGEVAGRCKPPVEEIAERVLAKTGYDPDKFQIEAHLRRQSPDIAESVENPWEKREGRLQGKPELDLGAGDQGFMVGYACNETTQLMPMPIVLANRIVQELSACRRNEYITGILPDGKAQVTVEYEDGQPVRTESVVVSCQHAEDKDLKRLAREIQHKVLRPALRPLPADEDTKIYINPSGRFVCGGLDADTGVTGRKLMADTYGGAVPHGGGAFSGKDGSKADRYGAYMARYIAKNMVAAHLADRCQVSLAYAIGMAQPVMVQVDTFGTGKACADDCLAAAVPLVFGLTPGQIRDTLRLGRPIFSRTAVYGHFGRKEFPWERTDKAEELRNEVL